MQSMHTRFLSYIGRLFNWFVCFNISFLIRGNPALAQTPLNWRIFTSNDGLVETWVSALTVGPSGSVYISHGNVPEMTVYDGYSFTHLPSPGTHIMVYENSANQLWSIYPGSPGGFMQLLTGQWRRYEVDEIVWPRKSNFEFCPIPFTTPSPDRITFLLPDRLMRFSTVSQCSEILKQSNETGLGRFIELTAARDGGEWIAAEKGLAKFHERHQNNLTAPAWLEFPFPENAGLKDLSRVTEGDDNEVFGTAVSLNTQQNVLVHLQEDAWRVIPNQSPKEIYAGWRGDDGKVWTLTGANHPASCELSFSQQGRTTYEIRNKVVSSRINHVAVEPHGIFWMAGLAGLARYAPPLWSPPREMAALDESVFGLLEFPNGSLWFTKQNQLCLVRDGAIQSFPFPEGHEITDYKADSFYLLSGPVLILCTNPWNDLLQYDISHNIFTLFSHPESLEIINIFRRDETSLWILLKNTDGTRRLDIFDGNQFRNYLDHIDVSQLEGFISILHETPDGDIWLGSLDGMGVIHQGNLSVIGPKDGYFGSGANTCIELKNKRLWFGGRDEIVEYDGETWNPIRLTGLETVRHIIQSHDGSVWVGSGSGVHRYSNGSWVSYSYEDGLPDATVYRLLEDSRGRIWASSARGLFLYHPENDPEPPNTLIPLADNLREISPKGSIDFVFSGIDKWRYTDEKRLLFSYRIDDRPWSPFSSETIACACGFSPGTHRFAVRAMDRNWNVDPTPATFDFTVLLPWYREPFFILIIAISLVLVSGSLAYAVHRHLWLHKLVEQRTRDLREEIKTRKQLEEQCIQAQKMEAIGLLAGGVAHDFNNILMAINGYSDFILRRSDIHKDVRTDVEEIKKSGARAAALTHQLLAFSRKQILEPKIVDLNDLIENTLKMLHRLLGEDITLHFVPFDGLDRIHIDPGQIEQVILNLSINARDAMVKGGTLTIETENVYLDENYVAIHRDSRVGPHVMLAVSDTGQGIDRETQKRIFEPFFTTKERGKGTGLGLSTVYGIVIQCGGNIWVYSEIGKGTTFRIYFPSMAATPLSTPPSSVTESTPSGKETILVVEDDGIVRKLSVRILQDLGYTVLEARNGIHALQVFDRYGDQIDLVLTDVIMPEMNGPELVKRLGIRYPHIKVIYLSGYTDNAISHYGILEKGVAFLNKPVSPDRLARKVRDVLDN